MGISKYGYYIQEKQSNKEQIRTLKETAEIIGGSEQHLLVQEKKALAKIVIKCASMENSYYDGFALACQILKFRDPYQLMRKLPEILQQKVKSSALLKDENGLKIPVIYEKEILCLKASNQKEK